MKKLYHFFSHDNFFSEIFQNQMFKVKICQSFKSITSFNFDRYWSFLWTHLSLKITNFVSSDLKHHNRHCHNYYTPRIFRPSYGPDLKRCRKSRARAFKVTYAKHCSLTKSRTPCTTYILSLFTTYYYYLCMYM